MPNIGPLELAIVLIIALVIFGPKRLPELGRSMGRGLREFKSSVTGEKDKDEAEKPAELEESSKADEADEPVEGEVVAERRS
jgi:sec-independent protein translocase protein TatA